MLAYPVNQLCRYLRYLSLKADIVCCRIALHTFVYSLYSRRYSLYTFSYVTTCAVCVLPAMTGIEPGFVGGINIVLIRVLYVLSSSTIARYPCLLPLCVVLIDATLAAANLWII